MRARSAAAPRPRSVSRTKEIASCAWLGGGCATGADRPDRLVGDDDASQAARIDRGQVGLELALEHGLGLAGVALLLDLADAEDRLQAGEQRRWDLARQRLVGLAEVAATLGVAEEDSLDAGLDQHRRRDLAGEGARAVLVHVLGADPHGAAT